MAQGNSVSSDLVLCVVGLVFRFPLHDRKALFPPPALKEKRSRGITFFTMRKAAIDPKSAAPRRSEFIGSGHPIFRLARLGI